MDDKVLVFPVQSDASPCVCTKCRDLEFRLQRSIKLHTQTATQLAQTEALLVEARHQLRAIQKVKGVPCN